MKIIYCIIGPSASGKTTLARYCQSIGIPELVSCTSRKPRDHEQEGIDYYFINEEDFNKDDFIEYSEYAGIIHGLKKKEVQDKLSAHDEVCVVVDERGWNALQMIYPEYVVSIGMKIDLNTSIQRMKQRQDKPDDIERRIQNYHARDEANAILRCDYVIDATLPKEKVFEAFEQIRLTCHERSK